MAKKKKRKTRWDRIAILVLAASLVLGVLGWGCTKVFFFFFPTMQMQVEKAWEETDMDKSTKKKIKKVIKDDPYSEYALMMIQNYKDYSDEILEYGATDTDRLAFVANFPEKNGTSYDGELSEEDMETNVPKLIQWDTRWGYQPYGDDSIYITGCAPTCLAMVLVHYTKDATITPASLANRSLELGLYEEGSGTTWTFFEAVAAEHNVTCYEDVVDAGTIKDSLRNGNPIIMSMYPGDFTQTGHFIVLAGLNADGTIEVHDPNSKKRTEQSWDVNTLVGQARAMFVFNN